MDYQDYPEGSIGYEKAQIMKRFIAFREEARSIFPRWLRWIIPS